MALLLWWTGQQLAVLGEREPAPHPVRTAFVIFAFAIGASYVAASTRPIEAVELRAADRGLLSLCAWAGVLLMADRGVTSRERLDSLLRRLVAVGGALASLGLIQYVTKRSLIDVIQLPGLTVNTDLVAVFSRNGYARPSGTATHPIEFGVVLAMILPLALHYAFHDCQRGLLRRWYPVAAIGLAIPISVSRSAVLGVMVVLALLLPTWERTRRRFAYGAVIVAVGAVYVAVPGLLGTFRNLFLGVGSDSSALSRTGSYDLALEFIARAPIFGRGFGTFLPAYRILDDQFLLSTIETGIVGTLALVLLFLSGFLTARRVRRLSKDPPIRDLAQSLAASIAAGALSFATFDSLSFPMVAGAMFLLLGCVGALKRLETGPDQGVDVVP